MSKVLIYGNGESRKNWDITKTYKGFETWGCNAIYRDCTVDTLVGIDYGIQQEIYKSGYANKNECRFADWAILEDFDVEFLKMSYKPQHIFETEKGNRTSCVVQGKEVESVYDMAIVGTNEPVVTKEVLDANPDWKPEWEG